MQRLKFHPTLISQIISTEGSEAPSRSYGAGQGTSWNPKNSWTMTEAQSENSFQTFVFSGFPWMHSCPGPCKTAPQWWNKDSHISETLVTSAPTFDLLFSRPRSWTLAKPLGLEQGSCAGGGNAFAGALGVGTHHTRAVTLSLRLDVGDTTEQEPMYMALFVQILSHCVLFCFVFMVVGKARWFL